MEGHFLIGISHRTNKQGAQQLGRILEKYGNTWSSVPVKAGLHLKSSINYLGNNTILVTREFSDLSLPEGYEKIMVDDGDEYAANTLALNGTIIMPAGFPKTRKKLDEAGYEIIELDVSETRKMDGGLTCRELAVHNLWIIAIAVLFLNLPFGFWRASGGGSSPSRS
ncbi:MAG: hypothetical protein B1H13_10010 [Desulfobacteraceae bacterium 4484_190.3]|nr:MAG: hypothetical protein B1H13_10010 [Desulfobacteraceae bacterium 4484_190.3]